jgi:hypothetical protein
MTEAGVALDEVRVSNGRLWAWTHCRGERMLHLVFRLPSWSWTMSDSNGRAFACGSSVTT